MPSPTQGDTRVRPLSIGEDVGDDGLAIVMDGIFDFSAKLYSRSLFKKSKAATRKDSANAMEAAKQGIVAEGRQNCLAFT